MERMPSIGGDTDDDGDVTMCEQGEPCVQEEPLMKLTLLNFQ